MHKHQSPPHLHNNHNYFSSLKHQAPQLNSTQAKFLLHQVALVNRPPHLRPPRYSLLTTHFSLLTTPHLSPLFFLSRTFFWCEFASALRTVSTVLSSSIPCLAQHSRLPCGAGEQMPTSLAASLIMLRREGGMSFVARVYVFTHVVRNSE